MKAPFQIIGDMRLEAEVNSGPETIEARVSLHHEPDEDIRLLGLMASDVQLMENMLKNLAFKNAADYRSNLIVCRGAAERLKQRCTRLLGDGDVQPTIQKERSSGEKSKADATRGKRK